MSNTLYPSGREAFAVGALNWLGPLIVAVCDSSYVFDPSHTVLSSVTGADVFRFTPTGADATDGTLDLDDYTEPVVASGSTITQVVIAQDSGLDATSLLIVYIDTAQDSTPIAVATTGGPVPLVWPNGPTKIVRL